MLGFILKSSTWISDSHGLYDYESRHVSARTYRCHGDSTKYRVIRSGLDVSLVTETQGHSIITTDQAAETIAILSRTPSGYLIEPGSFRDDQFIRQSESRQPPNETPQCLEDKEKEEQRQLWVVLRSLKECVLPLQEGDTIKLGRFKLTIREIISTAEEATKVPHGNLFSPHKNDNTQASVQYPQSPLSPQCPQSPAVNITHLLINTVSSSVNIDPGVLSVTNLTSDNEASNINIKQEDLQNQHIGSVTAASVASVPSVTSVPMGRMDPMDPMDPMDQNNYDFDVIDPPRDDTGLVQSIDVAVGASRNRAGSFTSSVNDLETQAIVEAVSPPHENARFGSLRHRNGGRGNQEEETSETNTNVATSVNGGHSQSESSRSSSSSSSSSSSRSSNSKGSSSSSKSKGSSSTLSKNETSSAKHRRMKLLKTMSSLNLPLCRICLSEEEDPAENPLIAPCVCNGTMKWIHLDCLRMWMEGRLSIKRDGPTTCFFWRQLECELCKVPYPTYTGDRELLQLPRPKPPYMVLEVSNLDAREKNIGFHFISFETKSTSKLGRGHEADVRVQDISVSRIHAMIRHVPSGGDTFINSLRDTRYQTYARLGHGYLKGPLGQIYSISDLRTKSLCFLEDMKSKFGTVLKKQGAYQITLGPRMALSLQVGRSVLTICVKKASWNRRVINACLRRSIYHPSGLRSTGQTGDAIVTGDVTNNNYYGQGNDNDEEGNVVAQTKILDSKKTGGKIPGISKSAVYQYDGKTSVTSSSGNLRDYSSRTSRWRASKDIKLLSTYLPTNLTHPHRSSSALTVVGGGPNPNSNANPTANSNANPNSNANSNANINANINANSNAVSNGDGNSRQSNHHPPSRGRFQSDNNITANNPITTT